MGKKKKNACLVHLHARARGRLDGLDRLAAAANDLKKEKE